MHWRNCHPPVGRPLEQRFDEGSDVVALVDRQQDRQIEKLHRLPRTREPCGEIGLRDQLALERAQEIPEVRLVEALPGSHHLDHTLPPSLSPGRWRALPDLRQAVELAHGHREP